MIKVFSWNICWECIEHIGYFTGYCLITDANKMKTTCGKNIVNILKDQECDIIGLQEATDIENIIEQCDNLKKMNYIHHMSSSEGMITFYNPTRFKLLYYKTSELLRGRPYQMLILQDNKYDNKYTICINLHNGHGVSTDTMIKLFDQKLQEHSSLEKTPLNKCNQTTTGTINIMNNQLNIHLEIDISQFLNDNATNCSMILLGDLNDGYHSLKCQIPEGCKYGNPPIHKAEFLKHIFELNDKNELKIKEIKKGKTYYESIKEEPFDYWKGITPLLYNNSFNDLLKNMSVSSFNIEPPKTCCNMEKKHGQNGDYILISNNMEYDKSTTILEKYTNEKSNTSDHAPVYAIIKYKQSFVNTHNIKMSDIQLNEKNINFISNIIKCIIKYTHQIDIINDNYILTKLISKLKFTPQITQSHFNEIEIKEPIDSIEQIKSLINLYLTGSRTPTIRNAHQNKHGIHIIFEYQKNKSKLPIINTSIFQLKHDGFSLLKYYDDNKNVLPHNKYLWYIIFYILKIDFNIVVKTGEKLIDQSIKAEIPNK